jgi:metal-dependent amidase/aminoacylase/carboxypeptidase family protein
VAAAFGATADVEWIEGYPVTSNAPEAVERFLECATRVMGAGAVSNDGKPTMGGEDFSFYGPECPACFFQLGLIPQGKDCYPSVHTPEFDFNDDAIPIGMRILVELALTA